METQEEEKIDSTGNLEKVTRSIFILQRTRESLSSTFDATADLERGGSLLDNALARQLSIRKAELDNQKRHVKKLMKVWFLHTFPQIQLLQKTFPIH